MSNKLYGVADSSGDAIVSISMTVGNNIKIRVGCDAKVVSSQSARIVAEALLEAARDVERREKEYKAATK